jgi:hypothetical protein
METLEVEKEEKVEIKAPRKVLIWQSMENIELIKSQAKTTAELLNSINEVYPIESHADVPGDMNRYIFQKMMELDPLIKKLHETVGIKLDQIKNVPRELLTIKWRVESWHNFRERKPEFVTKTDEGFILNEEAIEAFIEKNTSCRRYLTDEEHIEKFEFALSYVDFVKSQGITGANRLRWQIPLTQYNKLGIDKNYLYPEINTNYCCDLYQGTL